MLGATDQVSSVGIVGKNLHNHNFNYRYAMPTTNLSIKPEPVLDFACEGWPSEKRDELFQAVQAIQGVTSVGGAGHSTMRVRYDSSKTDPAALTLAVDQVADNILPGHNFSNK